MKNVKYFISFCLLILVAPYSFSDSDSSSINRPNQENYATPAAYLDAVIVFNKKKRLAQIQKRRQFRDDALQANDVFIEDVLESAKDSSAVDLITNVPLKRLNRKAESRVNLGWSSKKKKCVHVLKANGKAMVIRQGASRKLGTSTSCNPPHLLVRSLLEGDESITEKVVDSLSQDDPLFELDILDNIAAIENLDKDLALSVISINPVGDEGIELAWTYEFDEQVVRTRLEDFVDDPEALNASFDKLGEGEFEDSFRLDSENANLEIIFSGVVDVKLTFNDWLWLAVNPCCYCI